MLRFQALAGSAGRTACLSNRTDFSIVTEREPFYIATPEMLQKPQRNSAGYFATFYPKTLDQQSPEIKVIWKRKQPRWKSLRNDRLRVFPSGKVRRN